MAVHEYFHDVSRAHIGFRIHWLRAVHGRDWPSASLGLSCYVTEEKTCLHRCGVRIHDGFFLYLFPHQRAGLEQLLCDLCSVMDRPTDQQADYADWRSPVGAARTAHRRGGASAVAAFRVLGFGISGI